jgi:hypothetical protein
MMILDWEGIQKGVALRRWLPSWGHTLLMPSWHDTRTPVTQTQTAVDTLVLAAVHRTTEPAHQKGSHAISVYKTKQSCALKSHV